jgi:hypothetical protein
MIIHGIIASEPVCIDNRIKFHLTADQTNQSVACLTELDFGQFNPMSKGDHVTLTGTTIQESLDGHESYFCTDSVHPFGKGPRWAMADA